MIVSSPIMRDVLRRVSEAAEQGRRTVLLGPTGAGKSGWRAVITETRLRGRAIAALNCALLDRDLCLRSSLVPSAVRLQAPVNDIPGMVEAAHEGTLFLDELGNEPRCPKALLRFLDSRGEYQRLGDPKLRRADVQLVCASNAKLDENDFRMKHFRDDLWYRLSSAVIRVPPARAARRRARVSAAQNTAREPASGG